MLIQSVTVGVWPGSVRLSDSDTDREHAVEAMITFCGFAYMLGDLVTRRATVNVSGRTLLLGGWLSLADTSSLALLDSDDFLKTRRGSSVAQRITRAMKT
jgi:hypothetical protein